MSAPKQTDLDRLQLAWQRLIEAVNVKLPAAFNRLAALRSRISGGGGVGGQ